MDPRLLDLYNEELDYLIKSAREFGEEHHSVAGRLGLGAPSDPDPYVERLLEGVAFLSARVQLKQRDQYLEFTQHLLQAIQPHYLGPMPSICIARMEPSEGDPALVRGHRVTKGTELTAIATEHGDAPVHFLTGHEVTLWPLVIAEAEYLGSRAAVAEYAAAANVTAEAGLRLRFEATGGATLADILPERLALYLDGTGKGVVPGELYRQICGETLAVVARDPAAPAAWTKLPLPVQIGFEDECALLPAERRSFRGYRLLSEYFACPERFLFVGLEQPGRGFARSTESCEIVLLLSRASRELAGAVSASNFQLFATPAINLFERQLGQVEVDPHQHEYHVLPDRTRPLNFEVFRLLEVSALPHEHGVPRPVAPLYAFGAQLYDWREALFYTTRLTSRRLSRKKQRRLDRSDYVGTETWLSLSAPGHPEWLDEISTLAVRALVTNRELPQLLGLVPDTRLSISGEPVSGVRVLRTPTRPRPPLGLNDAAMRVIGHLTPNYLSMVEGGEEGAALLRDHLGLYVRQDDPAMQNQVDAIRSIGSHAVTRRLPGLDRLAMARGQHIRIQLDDGGFDDASLFLFTAVIERFLAEFTTINSFTECSFQTPLEGVFARWPARTGRRPNI